MSAKAFHFSKIISRHRHLIVLRFPSHSQHRNQQQHQSLRLLSQHQWCNLLHRKLLHKQSKRTIALLLMCFFESVWYIHKVVIKFIFIHLRLDAVEHQQEKKRVKLSFIKNTHIFFYIPPPKRPKSIFIHMQHTKLQQEFRFTDNLKLLSQFVHSFVFRVCSLSRSFLMFRHFIFFFVYFSHFKSFLPVLLSS